MGTKVFNSSARSSICHQRSCQLPSRDNPVPRTDHDQKLMPHVVPTSLLTATNTVVETRRPTQVQALVTSSSVVDLDADDPPNNNSNRNFIEQLNFFESLYGHIKHLVSH